MIDPPAAKDVADFLAPLLPYLAKAGTGAAEGAGKKAGGDAWEYAKRLWARLRPALKDKPTALATVEELTGGPDAARDGDAVAALRLQLRRLLADDPVLAQDIARLWQEARAAGVVLATQRGVTVGSISGGAVAQGERVVQQGGKYNLSVGQVQNLAMGDRARAGSGRDPGEAPDS